MIHNIKVIEGYLLFSFDDLHFKTSVSEVRTVYGFEIDFSTSCISNGKKRLNTKILNELKKESIYRQFLLDSANDCIENHYNNIAWNVKYQRAERVNSYFNGSKITFNINTENKQTVGALQNKITDFIDNKFLISKTGFNIG
jgi:hypothetical protein